MSKIKTYTITISVDVDDVKALEKAAARYAKLHCREQWQGDRSDASNPVCHDLQMLFDPANPPDGVEINEVHVEED